MREVFIKRERESDQGTEGILTVPDVGWSCFVMELPWRENASQISCIPNGIYIVKIRQSPKFGTIFHITNVENRSVILMHWGQFGGDKSKGWMSHTLGCVLLGKSRGIFKNQRAIINSRIAVTEFMRIMKNEPFKLTIL
jgi:hypothetical protein